MPEAAPLTAESFSFVQLFLRADWVVKSVMIGLALASIWSWTIIIEKAVRFARLNRFASEFEDAVASGRSLDEVAAEYESETRHPLPQMLRAALTDWSGARRAGGATSEGQAALLIQRVDRSLESVMARAMRKIEDGVGSLAIVATASPFIGLFGTVWGIMNAFQNIAVQRNTNLTVVAPAIAEALFATAFGLIAAIPAYIAYNKFSNDAARFAGRLESFADDLLAAVARRLIERV